jgi:hypothetical protein
MIVTVWMYIPMCVQLVSFKESAIPYQVRTVTHLLRPRHQYTSQKHVHT